jgi:hypothetical protein
MSLKDELFPDTNITGKVDRYNQPILVGQTIKDETGTMYYVAFQSGIGYIVTPVDEFNVMGLNTLLSISQWVEVVLPAVNSHEAAVAMAPFSQEHNLANLRVHKYKSISASKTHRKL